MRMRPAFTALLAGAILVSTAACTPAASASDRPVSLIYQGVDPAGGEENALFVADDRGGHRRQILRSTDGDLTHPDWSPDGASIVFVVDGSSIRIADADGKRPRVVVGCARGCVGVDYPAWSPNGRSIAFTRYTEPGESGPPAASVLVVRDLRTGAERVVARSEPGQLVDVPRWSGDGRRLAFGIDRFDPGGAETGSAIAVVPSSGGTATTLTDFDDYAYAPDWNRRTDEIVFSRETLQYAAAAPPGARDLFGVRPDGTGERRITHLQGDRMAWQPSFAPDGGSILATLDEPAGRRGVRIDARTGAIERLGTRSVVMTHLKQRP